MDKNKGKFIIGRINNYARGNGWFFGHFMREKLLQSRLVDVSWKHFTSSPTGVDRHFHRGTVEINIVAQGSVSCEIGGKSVHAKAGDFYVIWPETEIANFRAVPDSIVIVIRAPSVKNGGKVKVD